MSSHEHGFQLVNNVTILNGWSDLFAPFLSNRWNHVHRVTASVNAMIAVYLAFLLSIKAAGPP